ncbi:MAG: glutamate--tRNA ligase family protein [Candidatus Shikimatogenerans sp. Tcar]|uniref:glutamine--tRNA ligase n=1 Tax=Candidatus Shikimatogenerans sp. Tcar TaxID=3158565 RepID=A0AAU7QS68_9FLAO
MLNKLLNYIKNKKYILNFRFAPEPSGYIHLGHIKSLYLNYLLSKKSNGHLILRFDDTNPKISKIKFVNKIIKDLNKINIKFYKITYASNYFNKLYNYAITLIKKKLAYVDFKYKKNYKYKKKIYNKYRKTSINKNLYYFNNMKKGIYKENKCVLRAKIKKKYHNNILLQDPIMYRISYIKHYKTKNIWNIYPTYDWAHGLCDLIENISYSLCSQEFEHHKLLYNWYIKKIVKYYYNNNINIIPKQYEYSRLNINYNLLSKRKIRYLIKKKKIKSWKDPRILTLKNLINRGYNSNIILKFIKKIGYTKRYVNINLNLLNNLFKKNIDKDAIIIMVVIKPIKIILLNNYNKKYINYNIYFLKKKIKNIKIYFNKKIYISSKDFSFKKKKNFYGLFFNKYIRLKNLGIIKIIKIKYNYKLKKINKIYCNLYKKNNKKKIKSTLQWVSNINKYIIYCYYINNKMFIKKNIEKFNINIIHKYINKYSFKKKILYTNYNNFNIINKIYQFQRIGYYFYNKKKKIFYNIINFKKKKIKKKK